MEGENLHLVHTKLSESLAFAPTHGAGEGDGSWRVLRPHLGARGRRGVGARARPRPARLRRDAPPVRVLQRRVLHTARLLLADHPSLKLPEDQAALWHGLVVDGLSTLATGTRRTSSRSSGKTIEDVTVVLGAEARMGIGYSEGVVKRGMSLRRFADVTATNAAKIFGMYPKKGVIAPGSDADICATLDPGIKKTVRREDFHVSDYSPWEGWAIEGWPVMTLLRGKVIADKGKLLGAQTDGRSTGRRIEASILSRPACDGGHPRTRRIACRGTSRQRWRPPSDYAAQFTWDLPSIPRAWPSSWWTRVRQRIAQGGTRPPARAAGQRGAGRLSLRPDRGRRRPDYFAAARAARARAARDLPHRRLGVVG